MKEGTSFFRFAAFFSEFPLAVFFLNFRAADIFRISSHNRVQAVLLCRLLRERGSALPHQMKEDVF
jgi:hypothetical protein